MTETPSTPSTPTVLPCPFCGNPDVWERYGCPNTVVCHTGGTSGPWGDTEADAVRLWNTRHRTLEEEPEAH